MLGDIPFSWSSPRSIIPSGKIIGVGSVILRVTTIFVSVSLRAAMSSVEFETYIMMNTSHFFISDFILSLINDKSKKSEMPMLAFFTFLFGLTNKGNHLIQNFFAVSD